MSDAGSGQPLLSEVTGSFHYQELIESRLGNPLRLMYLTLILNAYPLRRAPGWPQPAMRLAGLLIRWRRN